MLRSTTGVNEAGIPGLPEKFCLIRITDCAGKGCDKRIRNRSPECLQKGHQISTLSGRYSCAGPSRKYAPLHRHNTVALEPANPVSATAFDRWRGARFGFKPPFGDPEVALSVTNLTAPRRKTWQACRAAAHKGSIKPCGLHVAP